jgi:hypothetical protein
MAHKLPDGRRAMLRVVMQNVAERWREYVTRK